MEPLRFPRRLVIVFNQPDGGLPMKLSKLHIAVCLLLLAGVSVSGCANTWHGVGEDTERAGEKIQDSAN
jgi:predicted small secreted protein